MAYGFFLEACISFLLLVNYWASSYQWWIIGCVMILVLWKCRPYIIGVLCILDCALLNALIFMKGVTGWWWMIDLGYCVCRGTFLNTYTIPLMNAHAQGLFVNSKILGMETTAIDLVWGETMIPEPYHTRVFWILPFRFTLCKLALPHCIFLLMINSFLLLAVKID